MIGSIEPTFPFHKNVVLL